MFLFFTPSSKEPKVPVSEGRTYVEPSVFSSSKYGPTDTQTGTVCYQIMMHIDEKN